MRSSIKSWAPTKMATDEQLERLFTSLVALPTA